MKTKNLDRVLKNHFQYCKMHQYSLLKERYCSCGIEGARQEVEDIKKRLEELEERFQRTYTV
jgi:hypothetical protein